MKSGDESEKPAFQLSVVHEQRPYVLIKVTIERFTERLKEFPNEVFLLVRKISVRINRKRLNLYMAAEGSKMFLFRRVGDTLRTLGVEKLDVSFSKLAAKYGELIIATA